MWNALLITQIIKTIDYFSAMITHLLLILTDILTLMNLYFLVMKGERCMFQLIIFQLIFIFPVFLGMAMYAKEFKTKKIQKLTEIKN